MDWKLHVIVPLIVFSVILMFSGFSLGSGIAALMITLFSSLFPDLDYPKSFIRSLILSSLFFITLWFVFIYVPAGFVEKAVLLSICFVLLYAAHYRLPLKHRGKKSLHQWRFAFVFSAVFLVLLALSGMGVILSAFFFLGYGTHLLLDRIRKF